MRAGTKNTKRNEGVWKEGKGSFRGQMEEMRNGREDIEKHGKAEKHRV